jgi:hypothetical protein
MRLTGALAFCAILAVACGGATSGASDAAATDAGCPACMGDALESDAGSDVAAHDAAPFDVAPFDASPFDASPFDDGPVDASPIDVAAPDGAIEGGDPVCAALMQMTVGAVTWSQPSIAPGDQPMLTITLTNNGAQGFYQYPGIATTADDPGVTFAPPDNYLFGISAGMAAPITWTVTFAAGIAHGTVVHFHAQAAALHQPPCAGAGTADFIVTLS